MPTDGAKADLLIDGAVSQGSTRRDPHGCGGYRCGDAGLEDMDDLVREGVASFKLFMAYPNVLMVDDATIFKAMRQTARTARSFACTPKTGR